MVYHSHLLQVRAHIHCSVLYILAYKLFFSPNFIQLTID
jgi:hypothetical protein